MELIMIVMAIALAVIFYYFSQIKEKYPSGENINTQYGEETPLRDMHPVLAYQQLHDKGVNPANLGDPIRIPDVVKGPVGLYGQPSQFVDSLRFSFGSYTSPTMNVPVPMGALKKSNENYNPDMFRFSPLAAGTIASVERNGVPVPGESNILMNNTTIPGANLPFQQKPLISGDFFKPYGPNVQVSGVPFFGSVNAYAPFPEVNTPWEKAGILTSEGDKNNILNLYRRPIAPLQELWEYQVQDKDGFVIKLENIKYVENGDTIHHIIGKNGLGPWKVHIFVQNKYIWV